MRSAFFGYFRERIVKCASKVLIMCAVFVMLSGTYSYASGETSAGQGTSAVVGFFMSLSAVMVPLIELSVTNKAAASDLLFSLPISRKKAALSHWLAGLVLLTAADMILFFTFGIFLSVNHNIAVAIPYTFRSRFPYILLCSLSATSETHLPTRL